MIEQLEDQNGPHSPFPWYMSEIIVSLNEICYNDMMAAMRPLPQVFQALFPHGHAVHDEMWPVIADDPTGFWYLIRETVNSFNDII